MGKIIKTGLKWAGIVVGSLLGILLVALTTIYILSIVRLNKSYTIPSTALAIPTDTATIAEGQRQFFTRGCVDCHGENGAGKMVVDDPLVGTIMGSNLTGGQGGVGQWYQSADWERAIRHGVGYDGRPLVIMPAHEYNPINDADLSAMIAYVDSLAPVDHERAPLYLGPLGRILHVSGMVTVVPAEVIDHTAPRPETVARAATQEYGAYLAKTCTGCHGVTLSGGPMPGVPSDGPAPRNLTPDAATGLGAWQEADFVKALRTGVRPDGSQLSTAMPWPAFQQMTDEELQALWLYLQSVPAKPYGNR